MTLIAAMPLIGLSRAGHKFNVAFMWLLTTVIILLTGLAFWEDGRDPSHQAAIAEADRDAHRVKELASLPSRIPVSYTHLTLPTICSV